MALKGFWPKDSFSTTTMQVSTNPGAVGEQSNAPKQAANTPPSQGKPSAAAKDASTSAPQPGSSNQTSEYLKVLSRLEGMLEEGNVPEVALTGFAGAIRKKLSGLGEPQKAALLRMPEVKALAVETLEQLPEAIKEQMQDKDTRPVVMKLLKHPKFSELMRDEPAPNTYTPKTMGLAPRKPAAMPAVTAPPTPAAVQIYWVPRTRHRATKHQVTRDRTTGRP